MLALAKVLLVVAVMTALLGLSLIFLSRLTHGNPLPGDWVFTWNGVRIYLPLTSCLLISLLASGILFTINLLRS